MLRRSGIVLTLMNAKKFRHASALLFLPLCSVALFGQRIAVSDTGKGLLMENRAYESLVVAEVGKHTISAQEFLLNYAFGPAFPKRDKDSKRRYLDFMIYEKLLALDGYAKGFDMTPDANVSLAEIKGDLATEELYKTDILARVRVAESDIQRGVRNERTTIVVRWIYAQSRERIDEDITSMKHGISFDSLYSSQLRGFVKQDDRQMEITKFKLSMKNPLCSNVLDTLKAGNISSPIKAPDGWYLFTTTHGWRQPVITQFEEMKLREIVERTLIEHISDSLSDRYIQTIMTDHHPTIVRRTLDVVYSHLAKRILSPAQFSEWKIDQRFFVRWGIENYDTIKRGLTLVELKGKRYSTNEFLSWYKAREVNLHLTMTSPELFYSSLEQLVWRMVRDKLLTERAMARGFQHRATVQRQIQWWKDKIVYTIEKARIADSVHYDESMLKTYYAEYPQRFRDSTGRVVPFEEAKDNVTREYYSYEVTKRTMQKILKLKERYKVKVNEQTLEALSVDTENDPRAIDVYVAKTGGIFPRPAFPTIDMDWQVWN